MIIFTKKIEKVEKICKKIIINMFQKTLRLGVLPKGDSREPKGKGIKNEAKEKFHKTIVDFCA